MPDSYVSTADAYQLALGHHQAGRFDAAQAVCTQILQTDPGHANALDYLGVAAYQRGNYQVALGLIKRAIHRNPTQHTYYQHIGPVYRALQQYDAALDAFYQAIALQPTDADTHNNLGNLHRQMGNFQQAMDAFRQALNSKPDDPVICYNLGGALTDAGLLGDAIAYFQRAIHKRPDYADAHNDLGKVYRIIGRLGEAEKCYLQAIRFNPRHSLAHNNLAGIYKLHGAADKAIEHYRLAIGIDPTYADAYSNMLFALQYSDVMTTPELFGEHLNFAKCFEVPLKSQWQPHNNPRQPDRKLNIGYVSADFNHHAVAYFIEPVLASHDKTKVAVTCYYNGTRSDAFTQRIVAVADRWVPCRAMSDAQLAERIRHDRIDILIDLSGHTAGNRLLAFARKPAPIQITWLGYFSTTGLQAMDYRFTDPYMDPPGLADSIHTEKLLRLPHFSPFQPAENSPPVNGLPALATRKFTLASLNNLAKLNKRVISLWARILQALPYATLMLCNIGDEETKRIVLEMFGDAGVGEHRLDLQPWLPTLEYLALHHHIDLALDTFPYNGGTITNHSLWMGVPVVTLEGDRPVGRIGASLMMRAGLPQFIAKTEEEYIQCVVRIAGDLPALDAIRAGMRNRLNENSHTTTTELTRSVEKAYRSVWCNWCGAEDKVNLQVGLELHKSGSLADAQAIYQRVLQREPNNVDALLFSGVLRHQQGQLDAAVGLISKAIAIAPTEVMYCKLAAVQHQLGQLQSAATSLQAALSINPANAEVHLQEAELFKQLGYLSFAADHARQAVALQPGSAQAQGVLGSVLKLQGDLDGALACFDKALLLHPGYLPANLNRGNVLFVQGKHAAAIESYQRVLDVAPNNAQALNGLGAAMQGLGNIDGAIACFEKAIAGDPAFAEALSNLANAFKEQGKPQLAIDLCRRAVALKPDFAPAHLNLGDALQALGMLDEAVLSYDQAIALKPDFVEALSNMGSAQQLQGKLKEAQCTYRRALDIAPESTRIHSNLLFALSFDTTPVQYLEQARLFDASVSAMAKPYKNWPLCGLAGGPLRVGLVSGDFNSHPVGFFLEALVGVIDKTRVELHAYPTNARVDDLTHRIKPHFARWTPIAGLSNHDAAGRIHADGVHLLVDLAGHTAQNRLPVFAWKPAPLQLAWLGYWASTGISAVDYLLADPISVRPGHEKDFSERIWRLPTTRMCFTPPPLAPHVSELPALRNGLVTFASFQNIFKINDAVLEAWANILRALPTAKLRLQNKQMRSPSERVSLERRLQALGLGMDRLSLVGPQPRQAYLEAHHEVDIILDTFPYPGGTTTCEALWMGVPTITLEGATMLAQQGVSLLSAAAMADWVAKNPTEYVQLAVRHATHIVDLATVRRNLREKVRNSPLFDAQGFARQWEDALCEIWRSHLDQTT